MGLEPLCLCLLSLNLINNSHFLVQKLFDERLHYLCSLVEEMKLEVKNLIPVVHNYLCYLVVFIRFFIVIDSQEFLQLESRKTIL